MINNSFDSNFDRIFKNNLKISTRSISVKTLLSDRNLSRIDYKPYYQRNYVWDSTKASFFIESILLGTDIPPLILFKSGKKIEVIDGRQRFETLKRYKENAFKLSINGLMELKVLKGQTFSSLSDEIKEAFLDTKVRVFEFEVVNEPRLTSDLEDKIKKEIFRRYNTGITPISSSELDNAKYDDDELTFLIKNELEGDKILFEKIKKCFFSNKKGNTELSTMTDFFRRYITLSSFPIYSYAGSGSRTEVRELLYDFIKSDIDDKKSYIANFQSMILEVIKIHEEFIKSDESLNNKLIYECILWGLTILREEAIHYYIDCEFIDKLKIHLLNNIDCYSIDGAHYYSNIVKRYENIAGFFSANYDVDFSSNIKDDEFKARVSKLKQTEEDGFMRMSVLEKLRVLKPEPSSEPVEEVVSDLITKKYQLRPSYQRQEKINIYKASAIIESILLGIYLPPIFIFKNKDGVKEVIDGQQRLLSILGFMGKKYLNEKGVEANSKNNLFSLKGLKVLTTLNGSKFNELPDELSERILDFDLNIIEIDSKLNPDFEPVDLFIRLNNKPYPIKENSFEMWNSTVDNEVIKSIKETTDNNIAWFFYRLTKKDRVSDRMENEELVTVLSYLEYLEQTNSSIKGVDFYPKLDRLNCRITNKAGITLFLNGLISDPKKKRAFIDSIYQTSLFIEKISLLLDDESGKELSDDELSNRFNSLLNVKGITGFKRSLQDIYLLWMVVHSIEVNVIVSMKESIINDLVYLLNQMKNTKNKKVNEEYLMNFKENIESTIRKYQK
ncbi:TPA: DUF262 domain-containing protein [Photobacterium damselae]